MRIILIFTLLIIRSAIAQTDTITVVSYNLLNFPDGRDDCGTNVVVPNRTDTLRKIMGYLKPDIFVACEVQTQEGADSVLTRSLNVFGTTSYAMATFNESGNSLLHNSMYYNTDKLTLQWQDQIVTSPRNIDHYVLYVNDPNLGVYYDTTFIEVYMCHLKAGSGSAEQSTRANQTQALMSYIANRPSDRNHFICGDLNVYSSNEQGYQNLLSGPAALNDPINSPGSWNNNASFAAIHTQSTRSSLNYDCGSKGGMDDRFDQILVSDNVMAGSDSLRYLTNSYAAVGNDGNHFNTNLLAAPVNALYPDSVVRALYYMSDHMPVALKAVVTYPTSNGLALYPVVTSVTCPGASDGTATIVPNDGQSPYTYQWDSNTGNQTTQTANNLVAGSYCVVVTDALGETDDYCVYVSQPDTFQYTIFRTPDSGSCDGEAHVLVSGGTAPYSIIWDDPQAQSGSSAYNLCAGTYTVTVVDNRWCTIQITVTIQDQTSGLSQITEESLRIYPIPVDDQLMIEMDHSLEGIQFSLYNAMGVRIPMAIEQKNLESYVMDTSKLPAGSYLLYIQNDHGELVRKVIKL